MTKELHAELSGKRESHAVLADWQLHLDEICVVACSQCRLYTDVAAQPNARIQAKRKQLAFIPPCFAKAATYLTTHTSGDDWSFWLAVR
mmetsp:Transcript_439/g.3303  ORF Transcript_439/g.3303 Transcript_439/m.3303 type:complete len:89 (+) Transcript_439:1392-1658(+)